MPPKKRPLGQTNLEKESEKDDETLDGENFKDTAQGPVSKASKYSEDNDNTEHVFRDEKLLITTIKSQFPEFSEISEETIMEWSDYFDHTIFASPISTPNIETESIAKQITEAIPENWKWVLNIIDEAHLPKLGLPVKWEQTQGKHQLTVFNPETMETIEILRDEEGIATEKKRKHAHSPVGFITSTSGQNSMPGTLAPAAVRYDRYHEPKLNSMIVIDAHGKELMPCIAHGDYVHVEALQSDHAQAKSEILKRQKALVEKLNTDPDFAAFTMKKSGMEKFFIQLNDGKYYGTLFFYELYFNDIDNIWLICQACNLHKSAQDTLNWLQHQWLYGNEFLDYIAKEVQINTGILEKVGDQKGLAQTAIEWFWNRHANYISIQKKLLEEISVPIQILGQKIDRVIGEGSMNRAERLNASLSFKMKLIAAILTAKIEMPRRDSESEHSSSSDALYAGRKFENAVEYDETADIVSEKTIKFLEEKMVAVNKEKPTKATTYASSPT